MSEAPQSDWIVDLQGVSKQFGDKTAVSNVDLQVRRGGCFGLLGPNGAGKTTTLRMIYGVTTPSAGAVSVFGLDVATALRAVRRRLGVTLQENALVEPLSPEDNLRIFGRYHRLHGVALEKRVNEMMEFLDLQSHAGLPVKALSGGYQRRLAIAMSLMNDPELLILDEPTTGLDPAIRQALWEKIRALQRSGTTILLTTILLTAILLPAVLLPAVLLPAVLLPAILLTTILLTTILLTTILLVTAILIRVFRRLFIVRERRLCAFFRRRRTFTGCLWLFPCVLPFIERRICSITFVGVGWVAVLGFQRVCIGLRALILHCFQDRLQSLLVGRRLLRA